MIKGVCVGNPTLTIGKVRNECNFNVEQLVTSVRRVLRNKYFEATNYH